MKRYTRKYNLLDSLIMKIKNITLNLEILSKCMMVGVFTKENGLSGKILDKVEACKYGLMEVDTMGIGKMISYKEKEDLFFHKETIMLVIGKTTRCMVLERMCGLMDLIIKVSIKMEKNTEMAKLCGQKIVFTKESSKMTIVVEKVTKFGKTEEHIKELIQIIK